MSCTTVQGWKREEADHQCSMESNADWAAHPSCCPPLAAAGAGAAPGLPTPPVVPPLQQLAAGASASPGMLAPLSEQGSDPTCRARCSWATSVAAVSRGEARMSKKCMDLNM
ncbi:hypothetical protein HaLaN_20589 [Haematococcus lacustris]|uniref:Uncharacterized protein n=1 Tax=Haematococcus lacustris TaxID=44745 RepID=A0A699ZL78_HAELA|nr:hypothetical protein HaLaN_20589 [Haematococcus lacustris]